MTHPGFVRSGPPKVWPKRVHRSDVAETPAGVSRKEVVVQGSHRLGSYDAATDTASVVIEMSPPLPAGCGIARLSSAYAPAMSIPTTEELHARFPVSNHRLHEIAQQRDELRRQLIDGAQPKALFIVGPCSLDDAVLPNGEFAVIAYAQRLLALMSDPEIARHVHIVMRIPPAKPRTSVGPRGLEETSIIQSYMLLAQLAVLGVPLAMEVMHDRHFARFGHLLSMAWVGARNVEDTLLRHAVGFYDQMPVWFKHSNRPRLHEALDAQATAGESHWVEFLGSDGKLRRAHSQGNPATGVILRGWTGMSVDEYEAVLHSGQRMIVDCSHDVASANSDDGQRGPAGQKAAFERAVSARQQGAPIDGFMLESYLRSGSDPTGNTPGMSRTDPCLSWYQTEELIWSYVDRVS